MILKLKRVESFHARECPYAKKMVSSPSPSPILKMKSDAYYIPKRNRSRPLGEDAHFISEETQTLGLADGVGGWAAKGIDAGEYSRQLMTNCLLAIAQEYSPYSTSSIDPHRVLSKAYSNTTAKGSSTACIVSLDGDILRATNLGDSGFMIFRNQKIVFKSPVQQYEFNYPYQLGHGRNSDQVESAWQGKILVMAGDIIVMGTDGLFDNMFGEEIEKILEKYHSEEVVKPRDLACQLAAMAMCNSFQESYESPFEVEARANGLDRQGGKIDDITVMVAQIVASD